MGKLENRLSRLEGRIEPSKEAEESKWRATRQQYAERLNELARIYREEGQVIKDRMAILQAEGHSYKDSMAISKDEVLRARDPKLAAFFDESYPPEIRRDPIAR